MPLKNKLLTCVLLLFSSSLFSQIFHKEIKGLVLSDSLDVDGILVVNKNSNKSTVTNKEGFFIIDARKNDTINFSAIQFKFKQQIITQDIYEKEELIIKLDEKVNELPEVVIKPHNLSGNLMQDLEKINTDDIVNGVTMGLPNATVTMPTQSERKLYAATAWNVQGTSVSLDPIINAISGRTKTLKKRVNLEDKDEFVEKILMDFGEDFFVIGLQIPENRIQEFLSFSSSQQRFSRVAKSGNAFDLTRFLEAMSGQFLKQINE